MFVDDLADFPDAFLEDPVSGGIGHHQRAQSRFVLLRFGAQVAMSILPVSSQATTTTLNPAIVALAGLVPWAELGIRQILRWLRPAPVILADDQQPAYSP